MERERQAEDDTTHKIVSAFESAFSSVRIDKNIHTSARDPPDRSVAKNIGADRWDQGQKTQRIARVIRVMKGGLYN